MLSQIAFLVMAAAAAPPAGAQKLQLNLDHLAAKAVDSVDVTLDGALLELAGKFLSSEKPDEAKARQVVTGLKGIYVRSYQFAREGEYSAADVEAVRAQLRDPGWSRIVGVTSRSAGENAEVYARQEGDNIVGLAMIATEPKQFTVVNIVGPIDLERLAELGGRFGVPPVKVERGKPKGRER